MAVCAVVFIFIFLIRLCLLGIWIKIGYNGKYRFTLGHLSNTPNERKQNKKLNLGI
jgi:hypothetical protein